MSSRPEGLKPEVRLADKFLGVNVDVRIDVRYPIDAVSLSAGTAFANRANSM